MNLKLCACQQDLIGSGKQGVLANVYQVKANEVLPRLDSTLVEHRSSSPLSLRHGLREAMSNTSHTSGPTLLS